MRVSPATTTTLPPCHSSTLPHCHPAALPPAGQAGANREVMAFQTWRDFNTLMRRGSGCATDPDPIAQRMAAAASTTGRMAQLHPYNWMRSRAFAPGSELTKRFFAPRPIVLQVEG